MPKRPRKGCPVAAEASPMRVLRLGLTLILTLAIAVGCSSGRTSRTPSPAASGGPSHPASQTAGEATAEGPSGGASESPGVATSEPSPAQPGEPITVSGIEEEIELLDPPTAHAGAVPKFRWQAVEGATVYRLFVLDAQGHPLWAWEGAGTSVWLGGLPRPRPPAEAGPRIESGSTWSVAALDDDGHARAVSPLRPVSP